jgi:alkylation response protein AidB-like acyl-CoA dehydrogenase
MLAAVVGSSLGLTTGLAGVVLPAFGEWCPPGAIAGGGLVVRGLGAASLADRPTAHVIARSEGTECVLEVATGELELRPVRGLDASSGLVEVIATGLPWAAARELGRDAWPRAMARAQLAVGHELVGAARAMLEMARAHALDRIQFGQAIGKFQAVRHRLAETLVAVEAADAALDAAWEDPSPHAAAMAKALAGRGARTAARHSQQVLAGIGFTTEHSFHRYVRRVLVLDQLVGAGRALTADDGRRLLASRQLPPLPPL